MQPFSARSYTTEPWAFSRRRTRRRPNFVASSSGQGSFPKWSCCRKKWSRALFAILVGQAHLAAAVIGSVDGSFGVAWR